MRILIILLLISFNSFAQEDIERFKLYPTDNINIHLKLDTRNGYVYMVQRKTNDLESMEVPINGYPLILLGREGIEVEAPYDNYIGRYKLYPTQNMWTFLMQDVVDGYTYQIQWGFKFEDRQMILINSDYDY